MRYAEIMEGREAPLYHWMSAMKAARCFNSDRLRPLFAHKMLGPTKGISLTRNAHYTHSWAEDGAPIRLTFNQRKLAQRYKIVPVDAEHAAAIDRKDPNTDRRDRNQRYGKRGDEMAEEFLLGIIEPLHVYLDEIFLKYHNDEPYLMRALPRYLRKFNVPFKTNDKYFAGEYLSPPSDESLLAQVGHGY
jgi:hypothetical protein